MRSGYLQSVHCITSFSGQTSAVNPTQSVLVVNTVNKIKAGGSRGFEKKNREKRTCRVCKENDWSRFTTCPGSAPTSVCLCTHVTHVGLK